MVVIRGDRIEGAGPTVALRPNLSIPTVDCGDCALLPGFVDVHIHGSGGWSVMDGAEAVARISQYLPRFGVTSWLPTLTPRPTLAELAEVMAAVQEAQAGAGAEILGVHLEGPFLSPKRPGALRSEWFRPASVEELDRILAAGAGQVRLMTLAPELPGGIALVRELVARRVVASIGHTDATHRQALEAIAAGVSHATHTYNAMRGFQHREPGVVGAVLTADAVRGELIADGVHVDPLAMRLLIRAKGPSRVVLITDAVAPAGLGDGEYEFDGRPITVRDGKATLADGTIAGSVATFDGNVRRIVQEVGASLQAAALMASTAPAQAIGVADRKGQIAGGRDADLVALDSDLRVRLTIARGQIVYDNLAGGQRA